MYTLISQNRIMGCHGNGAISHNPNRFFLLDKTYRILLVPVNNLVSIKIVLGARCKVGLISRRLNVNIVFFHLDSDFLSHNSFE